MLDATLINGLKENISDLIIINSNKKPEEFKINTKAKIKCVDISKIALEKIGKPFVNIATLGAFSALTKEVTIESLENAIKQQITSKGPILEKNLAAIKQVYEDH